MFDLIFVAVITGLFLLSIGYVAVCDRLRKGAKSE
jgi:hypothetical protein